jgi:hypothetical protein
LLLALASAVILGSESHGTHDHILLSQIRDTPSLECQVPVFISPRHCFSPSPTTRRATWSHSNLPKGSRYKTSARTASNISVGCCARICCRGNVFIEPLPRNGQCRYVTTGFMLQSMVLLGHSSSPYCRANSRLMRIVTDYP